jgi:hypothetical protein
LAHGCDREPRTETGAAERTVPHADYSRVSRGSRSVENAQNEAPRMLKLKDANSLLAGVVLAGVVRLTNTLFETWNYSVAGRSIFRVWT